ncbi:MAG: hypothetical protein EHM18_02405 [Acidobacteria bacterium]|nr:MAG: hypothetical protein EHM18_02405 [Acidobacteriota bacterium]
MSDGCVGPFKRFSWALVLSALLSFSDLPLAAAEWESVGPRGGSVRSVAVDPGNPNVVYAVGVPEATAGVQICHKSTDAGVSWKQLEIPGLVTLWVSDVAVDPFNSSVVYVSARAGAIWKSTDAGATWGALTGVSGSSTVAASSSTPGLVFAGVANRVYRSTDGGSHWVQLTLELSRWAEIEDLVFDPCAPSRLYLVGKDVGLLRTDDAGEHWTPLCAGSFRALAVHPKNPSIIMAGGWFDGVRTADGGQTWTTVVFNPPGNSIVNALAFDPSNPLRIYAGLFGSLYKSEDGGASWQPCSGRMKQDATTVNSLVVFPEKPGVVLAGCENIGFLRSTDSGQDWEDSNEGMPARANIMSITADPYDPSILYAGTEAGVYRSSDGGSHWFLSNRGHRTYSAGIAHIVVPNPVHPQILYVGSSNLGRSANGGLDWETWYPHAQFFDLAIDRSRPNVLWGRDSSVVKSVDGGRSWTASGADHYGTWLAIDPYNPDTVYAGPQKTTDGGGSWKPMGLPVSTETFSASHAERGVLYAGWRAVQVSGFFTPGEVRKSTNGGLTWTDLQLPNDYPVRVLADPVRPGIVYLSTESGIYRSADGGASWSELGKESGPGGWVRVLFVDPRNPRYLLAGDEYNGIYRIALPGSPSPALYLGSPEGLERLLPNSNFTIRWYSENFSGNVRIEFSSDGGQTYSLIAPSTENDGAHVWRTPSEPAPNCFIRISQESGAASDINEIAFSIVNCSYSANPDSLEVSSAGGIVSVSVSSMALGASCGWTSASQSDWIRPVSTSEGTSDAVVSFEVSANLGDFPRSGAVVVAGRVILVKQAAPDCSGYTRFTTSDMRIPAQGGSAWILAWRTRLYCPWVISSNDDWIILDEVEHTGAETLITVRVLPNQGAFRSGSIRIGESGFVVSQAGNQEPPLTRTYFIPDFRKGIDPLTNLAVTTGVAMSNPAEIPATVYVKGYGQNRRPLTGTNPNQFQVGPQTPLARQGSELFFSLPTTYETGWLEMQASLPLGVFFLFGNPDRMDGSPPAGPPSKRLYFTRVFEGPTAFRGQKATTRLTVVNPGEQPATVKMTLFGCPGGGPQCGEVTRVLEPKAMCSGTVAELFTRSDINDGQIAIDVLSGDGVVGFELVELSDGRSYVGLNAASPGVSSKLFSAQLATIPGIFTDVKLLNIADVSRSVSLEALADSGELVGQSVAVSLAPGQTLQKDAAELFPVSPLGFVGTLRVTADGPGIIGDVIFGDPRFEFASALLMQTSLFTEAVFGHVAQGSFDGNNMLTGLAFHNPSAEPVTLRIEVYGGPRWKVGERELTLAPGCRLARQISELIPAASQLIGGYILVKSSGPLVAQELFSNGRFLSAVPPSPLKE